jgi:alcohol dehydrogenase class IV
LPELSWEDRARERTVILRSWLIGSLGEALSERGWDEFELLSTERALAEAPGGLRGAASAVQLVGPGKVSDVSASILDDVGEARLVALGGGRVIDVAKAIASVRGSEVAAVPTTLSGAPMTAIHVLPAGHGGLAGTRPALVLADPDAMTSSPEGQLRATALNAVAHGGDSLFTPLADTFSRSAGLSGIAMVARSLDAAPPERDRSELALGALLCGYAVDRAGLALQHVISQTVVRICGTPHAETHAAMLPHTLPELAHRAPALGAELAEALGTEPGALGERIVELTGRRLRLGELGADRARIEEVLDTATARAELFAMTPGDLERGDLVALLEAAW